MPRSKMKNITIYLPEIYVQNVDKLQILGLIPSRSKGIRIAVRDFLKKEILFSKNLGCTIEISTNNQIGEIQQCV